MNDFWRYHASNYSWTWIAGSYDQPGRPGVTAGARERALCAYDTVNSKLYVYGGFGWGDSSGSPANIYDTWVWTRATNNWTLLVGGTTSFSASYSAPQAPGSRVEGASAFDETRLIFWVYGGLVTGGNRGADLWAFFVSNSSWVWISGSSQADAFGQYTVRGTETPGDRPGARHGASLWVDQATGDLFLFGGYGEGPSDTGTLIGRPGKGGVVLILPISHSRILQ